MSDDFGLWDVFLSMFWFMLLFAWIWMIIAIFGDIFRDRSSAVVRKALWSRVPHLPPVDRRPGLPDRARQLDERAHGRRRAGAGGRSFRSYVQDAAGTTSPADELKKLAELRDSGVITPADYEQAKAKVLA